MNQREYYAETRSIAEGIIEEAQDAGKIDHARVDDLLWEFVNDHEWVIYTHFNHEVLRHSANDGYAFEEFGADFCFDPETGVKWAALAFWALHADVSEVLWPLFKAAVAEAEEAAEEVKP